MGDRAARPGAASLTLPEPAAALWRAAGDTIRDELRRIGDGRDKYRIGGGSILAARWKHRQSHDVDLVVPAATPVAMLAGDNNPESRFEARLRALGGEPAFYPDANLWIVQFEGGKRKIDLWATTPLLEAGEKQVRIDGRLETVLSTAQILRGKLERAAEPLARDVFDIIKAGEKDAEALEAAVNAVGRARAERIAQTYHWAGPVIGEDAQIVLDGVPPGERTEPRLLGQEGAKAIGGALYTKCRIQAREGRIEITTATGNRAETTTAVRPEEAEEHFESTGLNAYLDPQGPGGRALREYAQVACRAKRNRTVFEADAAGVRAWRTATAGMNLAPGNAADAEDRLAGRSSVPRTPSRDRGYER